MDIMLNLKNLPELLRRADMQRGNLRILADKKKRNRDFFSTVEIWKLEIDMAEIRASKLDSIIVGKLLPGERFLGLTKLQYDCKDMKMRVEYMVKKRRRKQ